jgi:hypothetical protein
MGSGKSTRTHGLRAVFQGGRFEDGGTDSTEWHRGLTQKIGETAETVGVQPVRKYVGIVGVGEVKVLQEGFLLADGGSLWNVHCLSVQHGAELRIVGLQAYRRSYNHPV